MLKNVILLGQIELKKVFDIQSQKHQRNNRFKFYYEYVGN